MNKVMLMGRITHDLEIKKTSDDKQVLNFSIAINSKIGDKEVVEYIDCVAWNKTAEFIDKYFEKGRQIIVIGSLHKSSWENKDGQRQYTTEVIVREVFFTAEKPRKE